MYDYVHGNLSGVKAHLDQVERGTKLWDHYFVPRLKTKDKNQKLTRFGAHLYVAEDIGLVAFTQVDYKILISARPRGPVCTASPICGTISMKSRW